jgi:hypothetical protein
MTATPVERNYRPALRAERKRQSFYHDSAKNAEMYLTMKYGGDWWDKLTQETANVTGAPVNVPTQSDFTQEQKDALAEYARMRFEGYEGDPTALDNAYDAFKGSVRTGLSVLDAGVDWTRNIATSAALSAYNLGKNPNRHTFGEAVKTAVLPITRWKDAAYNTTLWTQIETALEGGMGAGFGAEGTGNGFYVNYDSPIGEEKARRAYEYASLENGEAASLGRLTAESIGWGKDTEQYKVLSGIVDGIAILTLDPLNLFTGGASSATKGAKVAQALKRVGITEDELPQALELIHRFGPTLDDADATTLVAEAFRTKARSRILNEHPDLKGLREQWLDDRMKSAAQSSSRDTDFIMDNLADIDDYRRLESTVDEVVKESSAATDNAVLRELEVDPKGATEQEARAAAERMGAQYDIEDEATSFTTSNGSVYTRQQDGTYLRVQDQNNATSVNPPDSTRFSNTKFAANIDDATAIQMAHERGLFLVNDDGTLVGLRFIDDGLDKAEMMRLRRDELMGFDEAYVAAGGRIERINVTLADTPTKGSFPIEWDDAGNFHAGSEVSEVVAAKARDSADLATKPRGERVTDDGTTPPRSEDTPSLGGIPAVGEQAAPSPIRDSAERLDVDPEEARRAAEYARNAAALEDETVQSYFEATEQLLDAYRAAGHNMADIDPEDFVAMLHAYHGLHSKGADISKAIKGLVGGNFDNIAKLIARTNNPADLYDLFPLWGADTLRGLAGVQDPHQVLMILFSGVLNGRITRASNRVARWSVQHGQSGHAGSAFMRRVVSLSRGGVPNSHLARFEDADSVVKLLSDFILEGASMTYRRKKSLEGWEEFRRDYLSQMIMAPTAEAKKRVWIEAQNEFLHRIPGWDSMDSQVQKQWTDKMRWTFNKDITQEARFADIRARMNRGMQSLIMGLADDPSKFNEEYAGLIHAASDLSGNVAMMDTKAIRKLFNVIEETGKLTAKGKAVNTATAINDWFDLYLRPMYLAMRPAYMLLQVADSGGRAMAIGATNLFTSPLQTMAIAAHLTYTGDTRIVKTLNKIMRSAPTNPDGTPLFGEAQMSALQGVLDDLNDTTIGQHLLRHQFRDFATRNSQTDSHMLDLGWQKIDRGKDNFDRGWAQTLMFHMTPGKYGDGMFQDVFDVMLGETPQHVDEWANSTGKVYASREDMVTDYYYSGPGQDLFHKLIDSAQTKRQHIPLLQQIAQDRNKLHSFLWADDDAASVYNRVHDLTGQFDQPVMQTIRQITRAKAQWAHYLHTIAPRKADKALSGKGKPFMREITLPDGKVVKLDVAKPNAVENLLASVVRRVPEDAQPYAVRYRGHMANPDEAAIKDFYEGALSWFFGHAGDAEKRLGQAPILRDEVLLESAKRVSLLSRADAQVARDRIMAQIPRVKRTTKHHEIVAALKVGMPSGDRKGMFTLAEVTEAAQNAAYRKLSDVAYGIRGRNAGAQRLAIMLPFIQSWVNAARVYMKAAVLNPKRSANALRLLRTANTEESGVAYDVMPGVNRDDDPSKPLFWTDDMGNRNVSIPYLGYPVHIVDSALAKVMGGKANPNFEQFVNLRVDRWNPLNFGEPLPGVGPGVTFPASVIDRRVVTIPTELRKWWFAMQTGDVTQDKNILEGNLPWFVRELIPAEEDVQAQMGNAVMALVANDPEKYLDENGYILEDKVPALTRDAESLAMALYRGNLWRAALLRGGTSIPKTVKDKNGELIGLASLSNEFNAEVERTGSVGAGYAYLVDKYGPQGIAYLIGMRDRVPIANDEGYQFAADNQELFDKTYDVMGYFFPSSDMNGDPVMRLRSKQYQRMLTESGQNRLISPEDWAARFNEKAKAVADLQLEQRFINGEITETQYEASKLQNGHDYQIAVSAGADTSRREDLRRQIDAALTNPTLRNTATGKALQSYLMHYDLVKAQADGGSLDGEGDAPLRAYLRQQGEDLCVEFPEFIPIWRGTLMWEVDK